MRLLRQGPLLSGRSPPELTLPLSPLLPLFYRRQRDYQVGDIVIARVKGYPCMCPPFLATLSAIPISWRTTPPSGLRPLPSYSARLTSSPDCSSCVQSGHAKSTRSGRARRRSGGASGSSPRATSQSLSRPPSAPLPAAEADPCSGCSIYARPSEMMPLTKTMIHEHLKKNKNSPKSALLNEGYVAFLPPAHAHLSSRLVLRPVPAFPFQAIPDGCCSLVTC